MLFSIIVPTFNNYELLKKTIKSVENQTSKNYELIIVDNNSADKTDEVIKNCNIENLIYKKINNQGIIAKSRNLGAKVSNGDWLIFLDSDDTISKDKIAFLTNNINDKYDLVCNAERLIDIDLDKIKIKTYGPFEENFYKKMLLNGNKFSTSASVIKKSFLLEKKIRFQEKQNFVTAEDYDFFLHIINAKAKVKFFKNILGDHFYYQGSQSSNYKLHKNSVREVLKHHIFDIQNFEEDKNKLWESIQWRLILMDFFKEKKEKNYVKSALLFFKILLNSPFKLLSFIVINLKNKF